MKPAPPADPTRTLELERFLPYRLSVLANTMSSALACAYAERFQMSTAEWRVVAVLARSPDLSAAQVAQRTAMDKVAVSRAVATLCRRQRVERRTADSDRRQSRLRLTAAGSALYAQIAPCALAYEEALLRDLPAKSRATLTELLDELLVRALAARAATTDSGVTAAAADAIVAAPTDKRMLRTLRG